MGQHDDYGKNLMKSIIGNRYKEYGSEVEIDYGAGIGARIDGVVDNLIAVEIESRVSKQIRGALLDLICHPFKKKLLVIMPAHASNPEVSATQCRNIFERFIDSGDFQVIVTKGKGDNQMPEEDKKIILSGLKALGFSECSVANK